MVPGKIQPQTDRRFRSRDLTASSRHSQAPDSCRSVRTTAHLRSKSKSQPQRVQSPSTSVRWPLMHVRVFANVAHIHVSIWAFQCMSPADYLGDKDASFKHILKVNTPRHPCHHGLGGRIARHANARDACCWIQPSSMHTSMPLLRPCSEEPSLLLRPFAANRPSLFPSHINFFLFGIGPARKVVSREDGWVSGMRRNE